MATTLSARRSYRRHIKSSKCRGRSPRSCRAVRGCQYVKHVVAKTKKVSTYCRKREGTKRRHHKKH